MNNNLLDYFENVKKISGNNQYQCKCPAHTDKVASLSIKILDKKALIHCKAGCTTENILQSVGLTFADITEEKPKLTYKEQIENAYKKKYGTCKLVAEYPYYDSKGKYLYSKIRLEKGNIKGKEIRYWNIDKTQDKATVCNGEYERQTKPLYRLSNLLNAIKKGYKQIYITEGEKDADTLFNLDNGLFYATVTAGGCGDWRKDFAEYFKGCYVTIFADNDMPGQDNAYKIANDIKKVCFAYRIITPSSITKGDITDYLTIEHGTKESLLSMLKNVEWKQSDYTISDNNKITVNAGMLAELIIKNEPILTIRTFEKDILYHYANGFYKRLNKSQIKGIICDYIPSEKRNDTQLNNIYNLIFADSSNDIKRSDLNNDERYINVLNGLYCIADNNLKEHTSKVCYTKQIQAEYKKNVTGKCFKKFITEFCSDDDGNYNADKEKVLQEYMGLILSNIPVYRVKKALFLISEEGNTGKSLFIRLFTELLGGYENVISINLSDLVPENRFILGNIDTVRLIASGDESYTDIKDSSIFKNLTGGDMVKVEKKGQSPEYINFKGGLIVACNGLPCFADDKGEHLFNRLLIVPCTHHIAWENMDTQLLDKLLLEKEYIFNWCIEGLHRLIDNNYNFTQCAEIKAKTEEYRQRLDTLYHYISENYIITKKCTDLISKTEFENGYKEWADANGYENIVKHRNIKIRLESIGVRMDKGKLNGQNIYRYKGLVKKTVIDEYADDNPFE